MGKTNDAVPNEVYFLYCPNFLTEYNYDTKSLGDNCYLYNKQKCMATRQHKWENIVVNRI